MALGPSCFVYLPKRYAVCDCPGNTLLHHVRRSGTVWAIFAKGIMTQNFVIGILLCQWSKIARRISVHYNCIARPACVPNNHCVSLSIRPLAVSEHLLAVSENAHNS